MSVEQALDIFRREPGVTLAEPNYLIHPQTPPNDPQFALQWALANSGQNANGYVGTAGADLDALRAWQITTGNPEVIVAVIDTGCNLIHPDLGANIWTHSGEIPDNGVDDDGDGFVDDLHGWDFVDQDNSPQDPNGHGTHVAGIIAARGNNSTGVTGVAWNVRIMPLRFIDTFDSGATSDAIAAIEYAVAHGAKIINCSWGGSGYSQALRDTMAASEALFVCAAGNAGQNCDSVPFDPAAFGLPNVLSVAASDQMDRLAWFSNWGFANVDVAAPGANIYSLLSGRRTIWHPDFNTTDLSEWTVAGTTPQWVIGPPPPGYGSQVLATNPQGNYAAQSDGWAAAPGLSMDATQGGKLHFRLIGSSQSGADYLYLEASPDMNGWSNLPLLKGSVVIQSGISGAVPYWLPITADLGLWDNHPALYLRWRFKTDESGTDTGYMIDQVALTAVSNGEGYTFMQGTSMAAACVSGVAALVQSRYPTSTAAQLKSIITRSVDLTFDLTDRVDAGGRVNAYNALTLLTDLTLSASPTASGQVRLSWSAGGLNDRVSVERRSANEADFYTVASVVSALSGFTDTNVRAQTTYYYRLQAQTEDGQTGYSPQTRATTPASSSGGGGGGGGGGGSGGCFVGTLRWN
jgi:subtilisin family serine protease